MGRKGPRRGLGVSSRRVRQASQAAPVIGVLARIRLFGRDHQRVGNFGQCHHAAALGVGEGAGLVGVGEGDEFLLAHAALDGGANDIPGGFRVDPVGLAGVVPCRAGGTHVADPEGKDVVALLGQADIGHQIAGLAEEERRARQPFEMRLPLRTGVFQHVHLAEITHRLGRQFHGVGVLGHVLAAGSQGQHEDQRAFQGHGITFRKAATASASASSGQSRIEVRDCQTGTVAAAPPTPAAAAVASEAERL